MKIYVYRTGSVMMTTAEMTTPPDVDDEIICFDDAKRHPGGDPPRVRGKVGRRTFDLCEGTCDIYIEVVPESLGDW